MSVIPQVVPSAPAVRDADYSDPFDAHPNPRPEPDLGPVQCENNGYMEPYEAQRVITGESHGFGCIYVIFRTLLNILQTTRQVG